jgi:hypothetical protein
MKWHRLACKVMPKVFTAFHTIGRKPHTTLGLFWRLLTGCTDSLCCTLFHVPSVHHNKETKCMWFACLLPMAPVHIPICDGKIYKYMWHDFKHTYSISCVDTFLANKNSCHQLVSDPHMSLCRKILIWMVCQNLDNGMQAMVFTGLFV